MSHYGKIWNCKACFAVVNESGREDHAEHRHARKSGGVNWTCSECYAIFSSREEFRNHFVQQHFKKKYLCQCGERFYDENAYNRHTDRCQKAFHCLRCGRYYLTEHHYRTHIAVCAGNHFRTDDLMLSISNMNVQHENGPFQGHQCHL